MLLSYSANMLYFLALAWTLALTGMILSYVATMLYFLSLSYVASKYLRDWPGLVRPAKFPMDSKLVPEGMARADEASHISCG